MYILIIPIPFNERSAVCPFCIKIGHYFQRKPHPFGCGFLYKENHALDAWFKKAYGDEQKSLLRKKSGPPTAQCNATGILRHGDK